MSIYDEVRAERERAHAKHRETSMEAQPWYAHLRQHILIEEVGEVSKEFNEARHRGDSHPDPIRLRKELIQVAAMATAWADAIPAPDGCSICGKPPRECMCTGWSRM